jgi:hypothetical protein
MADRSRREGPPRSPRRRERGGRCNPQVVGDALAQHIAVLPPDDDGTLLTTGTGAPYRNDNHGSMIFAAVVEKAKLPTGTTSHDMGITTQRAAGRRRVGVAVAERLGHENASLCSAPTGT